MKMKSLFVRYNDSLILLQRYENLSKYVYYYIEKD